MLENEGRRIAQVIVGIRADQLSLLEEEARHVRKSRSELIREAIDLWLKRVPEDDNRL